MCAFLTVPSQGMELALNSISFTVLRDSTEVTDNSGVFYIPEDHVTLEIQSTNPSSPENICYSLLALSGAYFSSYSFVKASA